MFTRVLKKIKFEIKQFQLFRKIFNKQKVYTHDTILKLLSSSSNRYSISIG